jgi:hypothetical protein
MTNNPPRAKPEPSTKEELVALTFVRRLYSSTYPCPGGHPTRKLNFQEKEAEEGHYIWRDSELQWIEGSLPPGVTNVAEGGCEKVIVITLEHETDDMGGHLYSYPVADGPCVEALGWDDDDGWYRLDILGRYSERQTLRGKFTEVADLLAAADSLAKTIGTTTFTSMPPEIDTALKHYYWMKERFNG